MTLSTKEKIAKRAAQEFGDGTLNNLGAGVPLLCVKFVDPNKTVLIHAENGIIGTMAPKNEEEVEEFLVDAGDNKVDVMPEGAIIDSATSFGLIRGGHLDVSVLGTMQVDAKGNIANWMVPGGKFAGMGGAMDLVVGARKLIVTTEHCSRDGAPKILKECTFPLTGVGVVDMIITELAVFNVTEEGLELIEVSKDSSVEEVREKTDADFKVSENLKTIDV